MVYDRVVYTAVLVMLVVGCGDTSTSETKGATTGNVAECIRCRTSGGVFVGLGDQLFDVWTVGGPDMTTGRVWHFDGEKWTPCRSMTAHSQLGPWCRVRHVDGRK